MGGTTLRRLALSTVLLCGAGVLVAVPAEAAVARYANCAAMNKVYKHGVGKPGARDRVTGAAKPVTNFSVSLAVYNANKARDGDKDGVACEKR